MIYQKIRAFTIIELLVVVTIIGLLASVVLVSIVGYQRRARDSRRAADSSTMEKIFAAYYTNHFEYPAVSNWCDSSYGSDSDNLCPPTGPTGASTPLGRWNILVAPYTDLVPTYISTLPVDPINDANFLYIYEASINPSRQCAEWVYFTERGGTTRIFNNYGNLTNSVGVVQAECGDF